MIPTDYMNYAIRLAMRHQGITDKNPSVGCVIVRDGQVVGVGTTATGGNPHAEDIALQMAGDKAFGADLYVTLEPCFHDKPQGNCTQKIIKAGIKNCMIACLDQDKRTKGLGVHALQQAGIFVKTGLCEPQAFAVHQDFFCLMTQKRPYITLKMATSLDGKIAYNAGDPRRKITNEHAHRTAHQWRAKVNAIAVGAGTLRHDNPNLDCRLRGLEAYSPDIVVFLGDGQIPEHAHILQNQRHRRIFCFHAQGILTTEDQRIIFAPYAHDLPKAMAFLGTYGIQHLLVEGGGKLVTSFLEHHLYDQILHFTAPRLIGQGGTPAVEFLPQDVVLKNMACESENQMQIWSRPQSG